MEQFEQTPSEMTHPTQNQIGEITPFGRRIDLGIRLGTAVSILGAEEAHQLLETINENNRRHAQAYASLGYSSLIHSDK